MKCLKPLSVTWEKPASAVPHMKTCVASVDDPLGRRTSFARGVLKSSGTHGFLFTTTEQRLFGTVTAPANATALAANGSGNIKPVVTSVWRDNGIGGMHETTYAYQGRGWQSTRNWGLLGFYATRETDGASGVSTTRSTGSTSRTSAVRPPWWCRRARTARRAPKSCRSGTSRTPAGRSATAAARAR
ncbi:MAG: hypothetical protein F4Y41_13610, partial [Gammaproteobacteria bacterium]|nr:hypothetical protein [Gammaproteobacteria bacterium]